MRINSRKIQKILGRIWTAPKRLFETFCTQEAPRCTGMNGTLITFIWFRKSNKDFSYTIFPVKKINVGIFFKIMRKSLFNYSFYSHLEIGNFRVWQPLSHTGYNKPRSRKSCVEGEVASRWDLPGEFKWTIQLQGSSATWMNVLNGRGFETILISHMLLLLPPLSPKILDTHYLIIIGLIWCMRSWRILRGTKFGNWLTFPRV
jgi:hypothetical protein